MPLRTSWVPSLGRDEFQKVRLRPRHDLHLRARGSEPAADFVDLPAVPVFAAAAFQSELNVGNGRAGSELAGSQAAGGLGREQPNLAGARRLAGQIFGGNAQEQKHPVQIRRDAGTALVASAGE